MVNEYRSQQSPLSKILVDKVARKSFSEQLLTEILEPFSEIEKETGNFYLKSNAYKLGAVDQILVVLCGQLAKGILGFTKEYGLTQKELTSALKTIPEGTIKSRLNYLRKEVHFVRLIDKKNVIDESRLNNIKDKLLKGSKNE